MIMHSEVRVVETVFRTKKGGLTVRARLSIVFVFVLVMSILLTGCGAETAVPATQAPATQVPLPRRRPPRLPSRRPPKRSKSVRRFPSPASTAPWAPWSSRATSTRERHQRRRRGIRQRV